MVDDLDVSGDSSTPPAQEVVSPATEPQVIESTEQGTPQTTQVPESVQPATEVPFNQHPRWQEVIRERDEARRQANLALEALRSNQQTATPVQSDPIAPLLNHPDPATAQFWGQVKQVAESIAEQKAQQKVAGLQQVVETGRRQLAEVTLTDFRRQNPDIKPGSMEESLIAEKVTQGYPLEDAKRIVMYDKLQQQVRQQTVQKQQVAQKRQVPPESSGGMPANTGLPQPKKSFRDTLMDELAKEGY